MNYRTLKYLVKYFGNYQKNTRGISKYLTNITFNGKAIPKKQYNIHWKNEIDYFIGDVSELKNKHWWKNDQKLYTSYLELYAPYQQVVENIIKGSRNTILSHPLTCISTISFYKRKGKLHLFVLQRSADISLGLRYDYNQMAYLLKLTARKTYLKVGKIQYKIINAHIYLNNLYRKDNFILN